MNSYLLKFKKDIFNINNETRIAIKIKYILLECHQSQILSRKIALKQRCFFLVKKLEKLFTYT